MEILTIVLMVWLLSAVIVASEFNKDDMISTWFNHYYLNLMVILIPILNTIFAILAITEFIKTLNRKI